MNPKPFLASLVGSPVVVRLKWGMEYRGRLTSTDAYFNVLLGDAEEWVGGAMAGRIGEVLIRYVPVSPPIPPVFLLVPFFFFLE